MDEHKDENSRQNPLVAQLTEAIGAVATATVEHANMTPVSTRAKKSVNKINIVKTSAIVLVFIAAGVLLTVNRVQANKRATAKFNKYQLTSESLPAKYTKKSTTESKPVVFHDKTGKLSFSIQLQQGQLDSNEFNFDVAGLGSYQGFIAPKQAGNIDTISGKIDASFYPADGSTWSIGSIQINGNLTSATADTPPGNADVTITVGSKVYHFVSAPASTGKASAATKKPLL